MADDTSEIQFVGNSRERATRTALVDTARLGSDYQAQQAGATGGGEGDGSGYWDGNTYVSYFRFGVSAFGGPDVFK